MRKIITITFFVALGTIAANAGKIVTDSVRSSILNASIKYNVYLPNGFDKCEKLYPVVYLLHGLSDDQDAWRDKGNMRLVADELIASEEACEMIIVMPAAGGPDTHNTPCGYFNMPGWNYEDFFFQEFIPAVENKYRGIGNKGNRAVMGLSMGGGGSTVYCQKHPDMFSSCYAMSAWLDNRSEEVSKGDGTIDWRYYTCKSVRENSALDFLDKADEVTISKLKTVKWFIDCGDDDFLLHLNVEMHMKMRKAGIKDELRVRNGGHTWEYWHLALRTSLPFATRNFD